MGQVIPKEPAAIFDFRTFKALSVFTVLALTGCAQSALTDTVGVTQETRLPTLIDLEMLVLLDNESTSELPGAIESELGLLLDEMRDGRRHPWRLGFVSAYPTANAEGPVLLGDGFADGTADDDDVLRRMEAAARDVHRADEAEPAFVDTALALFDSQAFADFHEPTANLHLAIMSTREDRSDKDLDALEQALDVLDVNTTLSILAPGAEDCTKHEAAPRLTELTASPRTLWSTDLCKGDIEPALGHWVRKGPLDAPSLPPNRAVIELEAVPVPGTLKVHIWAGSSEFVVPGEQVAWDGDRTVEITGPLNTGNRVVAFYQRYLVDGE